MLNLWPKNQFDEAERTRSSNKFIAENDDRNTDFSQGCWNDLAFDMAIQLKQ